MIKPGMNIRKTKPRNSRAIETLSKMVISNTIFRSRIKNRKFSLPDGRLKIMCEYHRLFQVLRVIASVVPP